MTAIVFAGPSLPRDARERFPAVTFRGPARQGDVYLALRAAPRVIAIIDGYFDAVPSVWHKEVLWAMAEGVHVLGASSMGALRAAELDSFGMEGVGLVYDAYRSGRIEDDDEVAVTHGPADLGYRPLTLAMVSIRATLETFGIDQLDSLESLRTFRNAAKSLGYWERTVPLITDRARELGVREGDLSVLSGFLRDRSVDLKAEDADLLLATLDARAEEFTAPKQVRYDFNVTSAWRRFTEWADASA